MTYKREIICDNCKEEINKWVNTVKVVVKYKSWNDLFDEYWEETMYLHYHIICYRTLKGLPTLNKTIDDEKKDWLGRIKHK